MKSLKRVGHKSSAARLGDFLKFLEKKFHAKVAQMNGDYLEYFEKISHLSKIFCVQFWAS